MAKKRKIKFGVMYNSLIFQKWQVLCLKTLIKGVAMIALKKK